MLSSLRRFLNEFNDRFTSETLDCTSGSNYATLFHQPVDRIHYILTLFSHRDVEWLGILSSYVCIKVCMHVLVWCMWSCMFVYGHLYLFTCMYVCVWQSAEPEDNSRSEKLSELFEERSKWMLLARQVRLLLYIHTYIHTYMNTIIHLIIILLAFIHTYLLI